MKRLPTVLLRHETPHGRHYDWLLDIPATSWDPTSRLWTARVAASSWHWPSLGAWLLEEIAPHRRHYLTHQGPIAGGTSGEVMRGTVVRIDLGWFLPLIWSQKRRVLDLCFRACSGRMELRKLDERRWQTVWMECGYNVDGGRAFDPGAFFIHL